MRGEEESSSAGTNVYFSDKSLASVRDNTQVAAQVQAAIKANYEAILAALKSSTEQITKQTTGAAGGVAGQAKNLGQQEIDNLTDGLAVAQGVISQLEATIFVTGTDLTPEAKAFVQSEIDGVKNALTPFVRPISAFGDAAIRASVVAGVQVRGLQNAQREFSRVVQNIARSLGIPGLGSLPGLSGLTM